MIRANDFGRQWADLREDALAAFETVGSSGWYVLGEEVRSFEKHSRSYGGFRTPPAWPADWTPSRLGCGRWDAAPETGC